MLPRVEGVSCIFELGYYYLVIRQELYVVREFLSPYMTCMRRSDVYYIHVLHVKKRNGRDDWSRLINFFKKSSSKKNQKKGRIHINETKKRGRHGGD